jgi:glycosyltransferase involved in cell wall biosynthesis
MKILHTVEFYAPSIGGSQEVVRQLSERMVEMGHDVTVATSYLPERDFTELNGVKIKQYKITGNEVRGYEGETRFYQEFLEESDFDVVMNYAAQQWTADLTFSLLRKIKCTKIFVPCGFSALHNPDYEEYFKKMPLILNQYDSTIYLAEKYRDIDFARKHGVKNLHVIPNGADEREFLKGYDGDIRQELGIAAGNNLIMHLGSFTGAKGQPEAIQIFRVANLQDATLLLVGNVFDRKLYNRLVASAKLFNIHPSNLRRRKKIIILQLERQKTVAALQSADVFLFPSNIEASPLVLFESCAAKTPFLTTDVGNAKEIVSWTKGGEILPTDIDMSGNSHARIKDSANVLSSMLVDDNRRAEYTKNGYSTWNKKYRWDKIAIKYLELYKGKK